MLTVRWLTPSVMTARQWRRCATPTPMLFYLLGANYPRVQAVEKFPLCRSSDRKLRLFACACFKRVAHLLNDPRANHTVEIAERFADGLCTADELHQADAHVTGPLAAMENEWRAARGAERKRLQPIHAALATASVVAWEQAPKAAYYASSNAYHYFEAITNKRRRHEEQAQANLLREIYGDLLFQPRPVPLAWRTMNVLNIAEFIYDHQAYEHFPILGDALMDAGCDDEAILTHCQQQPTTHVRGCWLLDWLLGRA